MRTRENFSLFIVTGLVLAGALSGCFKSGQMSWSKASGSAVALQFAPNSTLAFKSGQDFPQFKIQVVDANSSLVTSNSYTITIDVYQDAACSTAEQAHPWTGTSTGGVATFNLGQVNAVGVYYLKASSPGLVSACSKSVTISGTNLVVPIEMVDIGLASQTAAPVDFSRSQTTLDASAYDGNPTYAFEIVATNADSVARNVSLLNGVTSVIASIAVPAGTSSPFRFRTPFVPSGGADVYRVRVANSTSISQLQVYSARMIVTQTNASRTKIFIPLTHGTYNSNSTSDTTVGNVFTGNTTAFATSVPVMPNTKTVWLKNSAAYKQLSRDNAWTLEAVLASNNVGNTASAALYNITSAGIVAGTTVSTTSVTPTLMSVSFPDSANLFTDGSDFILGATTTGAGTFYIYRSGLWVTLDGISAAEIYNRVLMTFSGSTAGNYDNQRIVLDASLYSSPSFFFEVFGNSTTTQPVALSECGIADTGGTCTNITSLNLYSGTNARFRSSSFAPVSGNRYVVSPSPGGGTMTIGNAFTVISVQP